MIVVKCTDCWLLLVIQVTFDVRNWESTIPILIPYTYNNSLFLYSKNSAIVSSQYNPHLLLFSSIAISFTDSIYNIIHTQSPFTKIINTLVVELICLFFLSTFVQYYISNPLFLPRQIHRQTRVKQKGEGMQELFQLLCFHCSVH